jgi:CDP-glucose 4,6-dehydratase
VEKLLGRFGVSKKGCRSIMVDKKFWKGKKVFITGHTGFKGSWLCLWLHSLGAELTGFSLEPPTKPNMFNLCNIKKITNTIIGDVRNFQHLKSSLSTADPDIVFHMAAQPLVRASYDNPVETYETNTMGTAHLMEGIRELDHKKARVVINVTTDKCYENKEWNWGYRENEPLGGYDPYSNSKACSELVTHAFRNSYFNPKAYEIHQVAVATARAGNVIGGGDWATDRLIPDCFRSILKGEKITIRNPHATRPWQHVLEPLSGYITLAEKMYKEGDKYSEAWNFGPNEEGEQTVEWIVKKVCEKWGDQASYTVLEESSVHEAHFLKIDCSKARFILGWRPRWEIEEAIDKIVEWQRAYKNGENLKAISLKQLEQYSNTKIM